jgi:ribosomal protein S27AE
MADTVRRECPRCGEVVVGTVTARVEIVRCGGCGKALALTPHRGSGRPTRPDG